MEHKGDYPLFFYIIRIANIFSLIIFNFFILINGAHIASYFLLLFYFWLLIALSVIEIGYVIKGNKELFNLHKRMNILFISIYFLSIINILYHYLF